MKKLLFLSLLLLAGYVVFCQTTANDGDWKKNYVQLKNTPEADLMVRVGDIDNLNCGWYDDFDPFSGNSTESHEYPWPPQPNNILGLDMVMLPSSFNETNAPCSTDGYSEYYQEMITTYKKTVHPIEIPLNFPDDIKVNQIRIIMFVDDFQPNVFCSKYTATINNTPCPFISDILNRLDQTGPVGKIVNIDVPKDFLHLFANDTISLLIDDKTTKAGDGFAIDFIKILVNPKPAAVKKGNLTGVVFDQDGEIMSNATVKIGDYTTKTNSDGQFLVKDLIAGIVFVEVSDGKGTKKTVNADVIQNETNEIEIYLYEE